MFAVLDFLALFLVSFSVRTEGLCAVCGGEVKKSKPVAQWLVAGGLLLFVSVLWHMALSS